eukprot:7871303-Pyramimonas_sp.AAC.1
MHHVRYLGGLQTSTFTPAPELSKRLRGLHAAYYSVGRFWTIKGIKFVVKRTMLKGLLVNTALSGLEVLAKGTEPLTCSDLSVL